MAKNYTKDSIESLDYFEHIRRYPGMYIGSKDIKGLHHCIKEILSNSIDEYLNGAGTQIDVVLRQDGGIFIKDNGRGIPHGKHKSGCSILQACYGIANTGGKFNNATGESGYNTSGGEHGTGGKAVNALSTKMVVTTERDGEKEIVEFSKGKFISYNKEIVDKSKSGVSVLFYPDPDIFETIEVNSQELQNMIQEFSYLCRGLAFNFTDEKNNIAKTYYSEKGLYDYLNYLNKDKTFICNPIYFTESENSYQIEVALGYNNSYSSIVKLYTNNIPQEKGTHLTGFKMAWTSALNDFARDKKMLKDKDNNLTGSDFEEGQILILNFKMIDPVFKGQNKEELSSSEGRTYVQKLTTKALKNIFIHQEKDIKIIIEKALNARKAREAAKKAREAVREGTKKKTKALKFDSKLADCFSPDRKKCEIYVVEGQSAAGNLKSARDNEFTAVLPVRGKLLNVRKSSLDKIQKNAEIMTMIEAFGLKVDPKTMKLTYDEDELRYGKIIIESDADSDGSHIKNLFYTFLWTFAPQLIIDGYVYAGVPPLYKVTEGKDKYIYLKDDAALAKYKEEAKSKKYSVKHLKGLGEMSEDETEILVNPEMRIIKQVTVADVEKANQLFDDLMGNAVEPRKEFIKNHSQEAVQYGI